MKKLALITILCCLTGTVLVAQPSEDKSSSGSAYSRIGVGYPVDIANTAANSMGLLGVSYNETAVSGLSNPAHWGSTFFGLGSGSIGLESYNATNGTSSVTNSDFSVNQFQLQLPIIRSELGISASFAPLTESNYRNYEETRRIFGQGATRDTLDYGIENRGSGGVNRAELGVGWQINSNIAIGYAPSIVFVSLDDSYEGIFFDTSYRQISFDVETSGVGFGNRFGTFITMPQLFRSSDLLSIGASFSLPVTLNAERKETTSFNNQLVTLTDQPNLGDGTIKMPQEISAGLSYFPSNLMMIGSEVLYQGWSDYQNDFKPSENNLFEDRYKWGLGLQYFPYIRGSDKFLSRFKYRIGASYDTGHLRVEGQRINTLKFSFGLGIRSPQRPNSSSNSSIDLSFEFGIRGTQSNDLIKEQIWGFRLTANLAEFMFSRPKLQ